MVEKPTYEELEQKVITLENDSKKFKRAEAASQKKHHATEERLNDYEKKSRAWLEHSPICTKIVDLDFNLQYMSSAGIKDLQIEDITKFYGKPYPLAFYPDSFRNTMNKNLQRVKATGEIISQEASVLDIDGNELWYQSTIVPVDDDEGQIDYFIVVSINTTNRNQAEVALRKAHTDLENQVQKRTAELTQTNKKLQSEITERIHAEGEKEKLIKKLQKALEEIKTLQGIIPICSYCKKIRDDKGAWDIIEAYICKHSEAQFSHGICPECYKIQMEDMD